MPLVEGEKAVGRARDTSANGAGTATSADYTATSGTLTFPPGRTAEMVKVPILDDAVDNAGETLTLTLSNANNARIADATATGTIENSDPLPRAWLVRFGRTAADHAIDAIGERFESAGERAHATFAGRRLWGGAPGPEPFDAGGGRFGMDAGLGSGLGGALGGHAGSAFGAPGAGAYGARPGMAMNARGGPGAGLGMGAGGAVPALRDLLIGSSFLLSAHGADEGGASRRLTAWGRAAATRFDGVADGVSVDGEVATYLLGADAAWNRWLAGVSVAHTIGAGGFRGADGAEGALDSALTAVHPYLRYQASERVSVWGILGSYGMGELTLEVEDKESWTTDTTMEMAAAGARGVLVSDQEINWTEKEINWILCRLGGFLSRLCVPGRVCSTYFAPAVCRRSASRAACCLRVWVSVPKPM